MPLAPATAPANVSVGAGGPITFNLGDVTNANRNNAVPETVEIVYSAVVLNVAGNQSGTAAQQLGRLLLGGWSGAGGLGAGRDGDRAPRGRRQDGRGQRSGQQR